MINIKSESIIKCKITKLQKITKIKQAKTDVKLIKHVYNKVKQAERFD